MRKFGELIAREALILHPEGWIACGRNSFRRAFHIPRVGDRAILGALYLEVEDGDGKAFVGICDGVQSGVLRCVPSSSILEAGSTARASPH